jgi:hypothetical protein
MRKKEPCLLSRSQHIGIDTFVRMGKNMQAYVVYKGNAFDV